MKTKNEKEAENFLQRNNFHNDKFQLLEKLNSRGGGFVKKLAECLWLADSQNYKIGIKAYWYIIKSYIETELYEVAESVCKCGDAGEYTALDTKTFICKKGDDWYSDREVVVAEFRCDTCNGIMPEEIEDKVFP